MADHVFHDAWQMLGDVFSSLAAAVGAADKVVELIQQQPGIAPHGALQPADFAGRVELDAVAFSYPARPEVPVLNGLSLKINPGEVSSPPAMRLKGFGMAVASISMWHLPGQALAYASRGCQACMAPLSYYCMCGQCLCLSTGTGSFAV